MSLDGLDRLTASLRQMRIVVHVFLSYYCLIYYVLKVHVCIGFG